MAPQSAPTGQSADEMAANLAASSRLAAAETEPKEPAKEPGKADGPVEWAQQWATNPGQMTLRTLDDVLGSWQAMHGEPNEGNKNSTAVRVARDTAAGVATGAINTARNIASSGPTLAAGEDPANAQDFADTSKWDDLTNRVSKTAYDFRDAVAVKDPNMVDTMWQGVAQTMPAWLGFSSGIDKVHKMSQVLNWSLAGLATAQTVQTPKSEMRLADLYRVAQNSNDAFVQNVLKDVPGGLDHFLRFMASDENDTDQQGRAKNSIEDFITNAGLGAVGSVVRTFLPLVKEGQAGLGKLMVNDVRKLSDLKAPAAAAEVGAPAVQSADALRKEYVDLSVQSKALARQQAAGQISDADYIKQIQPIHDRLIELSTQNLRKDVPGAGTVLPTERLLSAKELRARALAEPQNDRRAPEMAAPGFAPAGNEVVPPALPAAVKDEATGSGMPIVQVPAVGEFVHSLKQQTGNTAGHSSAAIATALLESMPGGHPQQDFMRELIQRHLENPALQGSRTIVHAEPSKTNPNWPASYSSNNHRINLYPGAFETHVGETTRIFAHELTHAARYHMMAEQPELYDAMSGLRAQAMESHPVGMSALKGSRDKPDFGGNRYGFLNADEFSAEIESNPTFQNSMKHTFVRGTDGQIRSVWDQYKQLWGKAFGLSAAAIASPYFDEVLKAHGGGEDRG